MFYYALALDLVYVVPLLGHMLVYGAPKADRVDSTINETDFSIECVQDSQTTATLFGILSAAVSLGLGVKYVRATRDTITLFNESK